MEKECEYCSSDFNNRKYLLKDEIDFGILGKYKLYTYTVPNAIKGKTAPSIEISITNNDCGGEIYYEEYKINFCPICGRRLINE